MLIPDPNTPSVPRRPGQDTAGHVEEHVGGIERLAVERLARLAWLDAGAARHRAGIKSVAADRATGIGPGAASRRVEGLAADRPP
jgi:hypothetical protein